MSRILRIPRNAALAAIAVIVTTASLVSFAESYRGLYDWARGHGLSGGWAIAWPLQVDTFIAVGELTLFIALADQWRTRSRAAAWAVTLAGLAVSVAGNIGHIAGRSLTERSTAAVPPLAAAAALALGLGVLKRVVGAREDVPPDPTTEWAAVAADLAAELAGWAEGLASWVAEIEPALSILGAPEPMRPAASGAGEKPHPKPRGTAHPRRTQSRILDRIRQPVSDADAEMHFATDLAASQVPSARRIQRELHVGQERASALRAHLETLIAART